jgi:hypothetical protein
VWGGTGRAQNCIKKIPKHNHKKEKNIMFRLFIYTEEYLFGYSSLSREVLELTARDGVQEVEHESL